MDGTVPVDNAAVSQMKVNSDEIQNRSGEHD